MKRSSVAEATGSEDDGQYSLYVWYRSVRVLCNTYVEPLSARKTFLSLSLVTIDSRYVSAGLDNRLSTALRTNSISHFSDAP